MERIDKDQDKAEDWNQVYDYRNSRWGRAFAGLIVVGIGSVWLMKKMGMYIPEWLWSWPMLLMVIGVFIGAKHSFRNWGWLIPVFIGGIFMLENFMPGISLKIYAWPIVIIFIGLVMIFKPKNRRRYRQHHRFNEWKRHKHKWEDKYSACSNVDAPPSQEDVVNASAVFGSVKKNIISKNFKGGEINTVFGGAEINLSQADIQGTVVLEVNHVFGGSKLIVPANWKVRSEQVAIFGGIEDNRPPQQISNDDKVLILKGTAIFGGIDIKSF